MPANTTDASATTSLKGAFEKVKQAKQSIAPTDVHNLLTEIANVVEPLITTNGRYNPLAVEKNKSEIKKIQQPFIPRIEALANQIERDVFACLDAATFQLGKVGASLKDDYGKLAAGIHGWRADYEEARDAMREFLSGMQTVLASEEPLRRAHVARFKSLQRQLNDAIGYLAIGIKAVDDVA